MREWITHNTKVAMIKLTGQWRGTKCPAITLSTLSTLTTLLKKIAAMAMALSKQQ